MDEMIALNYLIDLIAYFVMAGLFLIILAKHNMDLFDPLVIVSVMYISIFSLAPIHDIILGDYYQFAVNTFFYGVKATLIAVAGYLALCGGYLLKLSYRLPPASQRMNRADDRATARLALSFWIISFTIALLAEMTSGKGASYILSLGFAGDIGVRPTMDVTVGFAGVLGQIMIPMAVIYAHSCRSPWLNVGVQFLTFTLLASQGFRYIVIIFVLTHIYVWYMKRQATPGPIAAAAALAVLAVFTGAMGYYREAMRSGGSVDWTMFDFHTLEVAVFENLAIYKTYYGVVHAVPTEVPYGVGAQMFNYTLIMLVPRALWPTKPMPPVLDPIRAGISQYAADAGAAYPNIGEYYFEFGVLGVVVFMGIFGVALNYLRGRFRTSHDTLDLTLYAVLVTATFQVVIRGYTPSNFYMLLVLGVPVIVLKYLARQGSTSFARREHSSTLDHRSAEQPNSTAEETPVRAPSGGDDSHGLFRAPRTSLQA